MNILNVRIDNLSQKETLEWIARAVKKKTPCQIITANPEILIEARRNPAFFEILNQSDLNVPDGAGLLFAAKFSGQKLKERVTGVDLVKKLAKEKFSLFFLGGRENRAKESVKVLVKDNPNLKIAGIDSGGEAGERGEVKKEVLEKIKKAKPDILLVAFGAPKQEFFISQYKKELNVPVAIGVGGAFDFISGKMPRAPLWLRQMGLEWLFRLFIQPKRWKRIYAAVIKFPLTVIYERIKLK